MKQLFFLPVFLFALCAHANTWEIDTKLPLDKKTGDRISQQLNRAIAKAAQTYRDEAPKTGQTEKPAEPVCHACGETIECPAQHCAATDYTGLCAPARPAQANQPAAAHSVCPRCGQAYTIDEKYHGVPHECPQTVSTRGGNGGEPETDPVFVGSGEPAQAGANGGEPETEYFCVADEEAGQVGNSGEPESPYCQEVDVDALHQAEALLQADRDEHDGHAKHTLEYYYKQVVSKAKQK